MPAIVIDASATLPWCFQEEVTPWTTELLKSVRQQEAFVPDHWLAEVCNSLNVAIRKQRISTDEAGIFLNDLEYLPITRIQTHDDMRDALALAQKFNLTVYDALYLQLAVRLQSPLATLDKQLRVASTAAGVALF